MGNCCSLPEIKPQQEKYRYYNQNNRYACVNQSPLQWRRVDQNDEKVCENKDDEEEKDKVRSNGETEDEEELVVPLIEETKKVRRIGYSMKDEKYNGSELSKENDKMVMCSDTRIKGKNGEKQCFLEETSAKNKKMPITKMMTQKTPNDESFNRNGICRSRKMEEEEIINTQPKVMPLDDKDLCTDNTTLSSIHCVDDVETNNLIETKIKMKEELSVRPKQRKVLTDEFDGMKVERGYISEHSTSKQKTNLESKTKQIEMCEQFEVTKCNTLPSKHKHKFPPVIKREKKSIEELIEAFKDDNSLIRAPCKEYLSDNLFKEAKYQHHQVLVSTLLPNHSSNSSFHSSRTGTGTEQSTFDIADIDFENRQKMAKKAIQFESMDVLSIKQLINSTPKTSSRIKSKNNSGQIQLFDIGSFGESIDSSSRTQSQISLLSNISHQSERKLITKSYDLLTDNKHESYDGSNESKSSIRRPAVTPQNISKNDSWLEDETSLQDDNSNNDGNKKDNNEKERSENSFDFNKTLDKTAKSIDSEGLDKPTEKCRKESESFDYNRTPNKGEKLNSSNELNHIPDGNRSSSYQSIDGAFATGFLNNDRRRIDERESKYSERSKENSFNESNGSLKHDDGADSPLIQSYRFNDSDQSYSNDIDSSPTLGFKKKKSAKLPQNYEDVFGRSSKTMRSPNKLNNSSNQNKSFEFETNSDEDDTFQNSRRHSSRTRNLFKQKDDCEEDYGLLSFSDKFANLNGNSPKCKRSNSYKYNNFAQSDHENDLFMSNRYDDEHEKNEGQNNNEDYGDGRQQESDDDCRSFRINNHVKVSKKGVSIEALGCELNLGRKVQLSLFNNKKSTLI